MIMQYLTLYDWSGQVIQQMKMDAFQQNLDIRLLASGAYFIKIETMEGPVFKRFVKQ